MEDFEFKSIIKISDRPELISRAAAWFSDKWSVPQSAYEKSMRCLLYTSDAADD